jgi:hypothetical protein
VPEPVLASTPMSRAGITAAVPIAARRVRGGQIRDRRRPVCGEAVEHDEVSFLPDPRWRARLTGVTVSGGPAGHYACGPNGMPLVAGRGGTGRFSPVGCLSREGEAFDLG